MRYTTPAHVNARSHLGALIDGAPDDLVGDYAAVLDEFDGRCGHLPLATAGREVAEGRAAQYAAARAALESIARVGPNRLGYELCLARLDATWETERAGSPR